MNTPEKHITTQQTPIHKHNSDILTDLITIRHLHQ
jgi:hypothetical protein